MTMARSSLRAPSRGDAAAAASMRCESAWIRVALAAGVAANEGRSRVRGRLRKYNIASARDGKIGRLRALDGSPSTVRSRKRLRAYKKACTRGNERDALGGNFRNNREINS